MSGLRSTVIKSNRIKKVINNAQKIFSAELSVTRYLLQGKNQFCMHAEKSTFIPPGCSVPSSKMTRCSSSLRCTSDDALRRTQTLTSLRVCGGAPKCCATLRPGVCWRTLRKCCATVRPGVCWRTMRKCSAKRSPRRRLVSPMYSLPQRRHVMQ